MIINTDSRTFSYPEKESHIHTHFKQSLPILPSFHSPGQPLICLLSLWRLLWWNPTICSFWYLASFTQDHTFKIHPGCSMSQYFIPFCRQIIFHCMDMSHFIYLFIRWWDIWDDPTFWLFVNGTVKNICLQMFARLFSFLLGIYLGVDMLGCTVILWLSFRGIPKIFVLMVSPNAQL